MTQHGLHNTTTTRQHKFFVFFGRLGTVSLSFGIVLVSPFYSVMASASYSYACLVRRGGDLVHDVTTCGSLFSALLRTPGVGASAAPSTASLVSIASMPSISSNRGSMWSSTTASGRWMSTQAGEGTTAAPAKTVLRKLLAEGPPRTAGDLWVEAERRGMKSKRFMKTMLKQMRERGEVQARPSGVELRGGAHQSFLYSAVGQSGS